MDNFIRRLEQVLEAGKLCLANQLGLPALILIYCVIDIVASLERQGSEGTKRAFVRWVAKYLSSSGTLPCTPTELYSARCGVIHTLSGESDLSRKGEARRVAYAYGVAPPEPLRQFLPTVGRDDIVIHVDTLLTLVSASLDRYFAEVRADGERVKAVEPNAAKCFAVITNKDIFDPFHV